jgi:hypothetical protein
MNFVLLLLDKVRQKAVQNHEDDARNRKKLFIYGCTHDGPANNLRMRTAVSDVCEFLRVVIIFLVNDVLIYIRRRLEFVTTKHLSDHHGNRDVRRMLQRIASKNDEVLFVPCNPK